MRILTASPSYTRCEWSAANCPSSSRFPPQERRAFHQAVLAEVLEERVVSRRGRKVPRGVKRKMSNFPLRPRGAASTTRINFTKAIMIIQ